MIHVFLNNKYAKPADTAVLDRKIDIGIFLCFLDICLDKRGCEFERKLFLDDGESSGLTLNAIYKLK